MTQQPWHCKRCNEVVGQIVRKSIAERDANLQVLVTATAELAGLGRVMCPGCGEWRTWEPGRVVLEELVAATGKVLPG